VVGIAVVGIGVVGMAVVGIIVVAGFLQAVHWLGHTTLTKEEEQRPVRRPQLEVSRVEQSKVGKSLGLAEGGRREGGTSVAFEVPPIKDVMMELTSSLHMLHVVGQMNTASASLHTSALALRSGHPLLITVS